LRKTGIPITLAIIYISIVKRVCNVQMDIIGLPGHIVVGLPTNEDDNNSPRVFIDVFNDARLLSISDCADLVLQYGVVLHPSMLTPLTNEQVWQRMVANLIHCHSSRLSMFTNDMEGILRLFQMPEYGGNMRIENFNELVSSGSILSYHDD
jgi:regulator of sirC expression with transglutaminase-like and TPR domain